MENEKAEGGQESWGSGGVGRGQCFTWDSQGRPHLKGCI